ncbi:hypothetical protein Peur_041672 [Populus x canadensis]
MLTSFMLRLSYVRVLVEVNLLSDLPYFVDVTMPNRGVLHQQVVYETLSRFCKHCRVLGHLTTTCNNSSTGSCKQTPHVNNVNANNNCASVFQCMGPNGGSPVVDDQGIFLSAGCGFDPIQSEVVAANDG